jgi:hypothetical protein
LRHHLWIKQNLPNPISRSIECIASLNLQTILLRGLISSRRTTSKLFVTKPITIKNLSFHPDKKQY